VWLQSGGARRGGCTLCLQQLWVGGTCTVVVLSGSVCLMVFVCECLGHCTLRRLWVYGLAYVGLRCLLLPRTPCLRQVLLSSIGNSLALAASARRMINGAGWCRAERGSAHAHARSKWLLLGSGWRGVQWQRHLGRSGAWCRSLHARFTAAFVMVGSVLSGLAAAARSGSVGVCLCLWGATRPAPATSAWIEEQQQCVAQPQAPLQRVVSWGAGACVGHEGQKHRSACTLRVCTATTMVFFFNKFCGLRSFALRGQWLRGVELGGVLGFGSWQQALWQFSGVE